MPNDFDSILEQCLSQIASGRARVESCLLAFPAVAGELEPLLRAAEQLRESPKPVLSPAARARIEARVLGPPKAARPPLLVWKLPQILPRQRWALAGLSLALMLVLLTGSLVFAAQGSLPGSPLYPVKRASEQVWLWLAPAGSEPGVHLQLAQRRLDEVKEQMARGVFDPALLAEMNAEVEAALADAGGLPAEQALAALEEVLAFTRRQQQELAALLAVAPPEAQAGLQAAIRASNDQSDRVEVLLDELPPAPARSTQTPTQTRTRTATPTAAVRTMEPAATPIAPVGLQATATPATGTPEPAELGAPTDTPAPSLYEPKPTATATYTPTPEGAEDNPDEEDNDKDKDTPPGLDKRPAWGLTKEPKPGKPEDEK